MGLMVAPPVVVASASHAAPRKAVRLRPGSRFTRLWEPELLRTRFWVTFCYKFIRDYTFGDILLYILAGLYISKEMLLLVILRPVH